MGGQGGGSLGVKGVGSLREMTGREAGFPRCVGNRDRKDIFLATLHNIVAIIEKNKETKP